MCFKSSTYFMKLGSLEFNEYMFVCNVFLTVPLIRMKSLPYIFGLVSVQSSFLLSSLSSFFKFGGSSDEVFYCSFKLCILEFISGSLIGKLSSG